MLAILKEMNLEDPELPGWAVTGTAAAVAWGAPMASSSTTPLDFYVPTESAVRRATLSLQPAASWDRRVRGCSCPDLLACTGRQEIPDNIFGQRLFVRPLFAALDLAQDKARGIEILDGWNPDGAIRVW